MPVPEWRVPVSDTADHFSSLCADAGSFRDALLASGEEYLSSITASGLDSGRWFVNTPSPALSYRTIPEPMIELVDRLVSAHGKQAGERLLQLIMANILILIN